MKSITINEALENLKHIEDTYNPCMEDAKIQSENNDKIVEDRMKEHDKEIGIPEKELKDGYTGNHNKKVTSSNLKAMGLSESKGKFGYNIYLNENLVCSKSGCKSRKSATTKALRMIESLAGDDNYDALEDEFEYEVTESCLDEECMNEDLFDSVVAEMEQLAENTLGESYRLEEASKQPKDEYKKLYSYNVSGNEYTFLGYTKKIKSGFAHIIRLTDDNGKTLADAKANYRNRTWEQFQYQSCMLSAISKAIKADKNNEDLDKLKKIVSSGSKTSMNEDIKFRLNEGGHVISNPLYEYWRDNPDLGWVYDNMLGNVSLTHDILVKTLTNVEDFLNQNRKYFLVYEYLPDYDGYDWFITNDYPY